jgi:translocation and assembly module TamB
MRLRGHTFENVEGSFTYDEPAIELRNLKASEGSARLDADVVRFNPSTGTIDARANIASLPLSQLKEFGVPDTLDGTIQTAFLTIAGTRDKPQIGGNVVIENFSFRGETFPRARLELETRWPILHVEVSQTQNVRLEADIDLATAQYPFKASASFTDYSLERLAQFSRGKLTASGTVDFTGQLAGQASFSGQGVIRAITANIRDIEFQNAAPFEFAFDTKRIRLDKEATFRGAYGTRVNVKGYVGLENSPPLDLEITGNLDLSEVTEANEFLSVTGSVGLIARVGGTTANPTINGNARITGGSLGRQGIYTTVSNLNGDVRFNENRMTFDNLRGQVGGGNIEIRGAGLIQNSQIEGLNVRIDAEDVNLRYPAGMRSRVTGALSLTGTSSAPVLSGDLRLVSLTFRSEFEAFLVMFRQYSGLNSGGSVLDRLRLAIHVEGNRNIIVQNELTDITEARIDLDVGGTWARPTLTGHIDITGGALLFSGERYEITRGNIDFVDRLKIDPVVDIQAETDLRDYRVILNVSGSGENIRVVPTSDPALPDVELVSLIAGGKTTDELERARSETPLGGSTPGNSSLPTSEELFPTAAATIFTDLLRSRVGSRLGLMGLDLIRIDPQFESATNNPSVRVTLSQQVSKDLSVTYSQDLSSSQQRLIMVEYFVSKNLSIVASREETNETSALGLDIKLRKRF